MTQATTGWRATRRNTAPESDRIALVDQLWKLKKHWQEHTGAHVPLNVLIKEVDYRRDVLDGAERSGNAELEVLVRRIRDIEERLGEISSITVNGPPSRFTKAMWSATLALLAGVVALTALLANQGVFRTDATMLPVDDPVIAFRLHGSNTIGEELAPALLKAWYDTRQASETLLVSGTAAVERQLQFVLPARDEPPGAVEIHAHGSSTAFKDLAAGTADLGMSSRAIKPAEVATLEARYGDLSEPGREHVIALDGLAVIVNPANPVNSLAKSDVARIFAGKIRNWHELGGPDAPIALYARDDNSGTFDTFKSLVLEANDAALAAHAQRFESSTELSDRVAADPNGIGFIGLPYVRNTKALGIAESGATLPIVPTEFTVSTEDYPLSRRLYFYMPGGASADVREFVKFTLSDAGQAVVARAGLVAQLVRTEPVRPREDAPARFHELTRGAERLSVTLRFLPDGGRLDNKGARDIERVVRYMMEHRDRKLMLLGFVDAAANDTGAQSLSLARARMVEQMFAARGVFPAVVEGLGAVLPVAANDSAAGRQKNRRVEVWLL